MLSQTCQSIDMAQKRVRIFLELEENNKTRYYGNPFHISQSTWFLTFQFSRSGNILESQ